MNPAGRSRAPLGLIVLVLLALGVAGGWTLLRPPVAPPPLSYTVVRGDSLSKIARAHGVSVAELRQWNGLEGDLIEPGQVLQIFRDAGPAVGAVAPPKARRPRTRSAGGKVAAGTPSTPGALVLPPEGRCLEGPSLDEDGGDEAAFAASAGLGHGQVKAAMDAALGLLGRCLEPGAAAAGTLDLEITVACTGRVAAVEVLDADGLPASLVRCVTGTLAYAPFPPHDMPDGFTFGYPMQFMP